MRMDAFSCKVDAVKSTRQPVPHDLYMTDRVNDAIYTQAYVADKQARCPSQCHCSLLPDPCISCLDILIVCAERSTNETSLPHEINAYLSTFASDLVTSLTIVQTPLTTVPEAVCRLEKLTELGLHVHPRLSNLPDNCFTQMHELRNFVVEHTGLTSLQNGLFDNLAQLQRVDFSHNQISSIDPRLFDVTANLSRLCEIDLNHNKLMEIDSWPARRAQRFHGSRIDLSYNRISRFTNSLGWSYDCNSASLNASQIDLSYNSVTHLNDMLRSWNVTGPYFFYLFRYFVLIVRSNGA